MFMATRRHAPPRREVRPAENDRISTFFRDMVPNALEGTDRFLDIVTWNIKFFNLQDPARITTITRIMAEINADVFVLQEIEDGAMDPIAANLRSIGAGFYKTFYGTMGGDQRVVLMYDTEFVRASANPEELFTDD